MVVTLANAQCWILVNTVLSVVSHSLIHTQAHTRTHTQIHAITSVRIIMRTVSDKHTDTACIHKHALKAHKYTGWLYIHNIEWMTGLEQCGGKRGEFQWATIYPESSVLHRLDTHTHTKTWHIITPRLHTTCNHNKSYIHVNQNV